MIIFNRLVISKANLRILSSLFLLAFLSSGLSSENSAKAEVVPDQSLGTSIEMGSADGSLVVTGGAQRSENLFHSFNSLSISPEQSLLFNYPATVSRIFGRVTGGAVTRIDGNLIVNGGADLFLINPAGLSFGPAAEIQIGGAFIASSAQHIAFADGLEFSAIPDSSLLSVDVPTGLGLSGNNSIFVEGAGHTLTSGNIVFPLIESSPNPALTTLPGRTVALIGGNVYLDGGVIRSPDGNVVVAGVREGTVSLFFDSGGWGFAFDGVEDRGDVNLNHFSLIDAVGFNGGEIKIFGEGIQLLDSSVLLTAALSERAPSARIDVDGQTVLIDGEISRVASGVNVENRPAAPIPFVPSSLVLDNFSSGNPGVMNISAQNIAVNNGAGIYLRSFGGGVPGDVNINSQNLHVSGYNSISENPSGIAVVTLGPDGTENLSGGTIRIYSDAVSLDNGGGITSSTFNRNNGGRIEINASRVSVFSSTENLRFPSQISALSLQAGLSPVIGNGGEIDISTDSLVVSNGGLITTTSDNSGDAGDIAIRARESIRIVGGNSSAAGGSLIATSVDQFPNELQNPFGVSGIPSGNGGSILLDTPSLTVQNNGRVSAQNTGTGAGGAITINSPSINLIDAGQIEATTTSGNGGNIDVFTNTLILKEGSINSSALGAGSGGNIYIDSDAIALFPNSSITANADQGAGGQVNITADALLRAPNSLVTATSAAGPELDGTVDIQAPDEAVGTDTEVFPQTIVVPEVSATCTGGSGDSSEFVVTGRGGLPRSPTSIQQSYSGWRSPSSPSSAAGLNRAPQIVEAQGWVDNGDGTVDFTAQPANPAYMSARNTACVSGTAQNPS